ncbi:hypothetical protein NHX12_034093 [Muraenolepis orangiensis]|uniref:Uncharacterized protein n=1 Tax=Muraenolepis orangiensis TaxID=630683 RepID=A0A9Q0E592_9TELE|nr:hypothetical protein NHX12_034093 [Muraenolepis orangiensis]
MCRRRGEEEKKGDRFPPMCSPLSVGHLHNSASVRGVTSSCEADTEHSHPAEGASSARRPPGGEAIWWTVRKNSDYKKLDLSIDLSISNGSQTRSRSGHPRSVSREEQ